MQSSFDTMEAGRLFIDALLNLDAEAMKAIPRDGLWDSISSFLETPPVGHPLYFLTLKHSFQKERTSENHRLFGSYFQQIPKSSRHLIDECVEVLLEYNICPPVRQSCVNALSDGDAYWTRKFMEHGERISVTAPYVRNGHPGFPEGLQKVLAQGGDDAEWIVDALLSYPATYLSTSLSLADTANWLTAVACKSSNFKIVEHTIRCAENLGLKIDFRAVAPNVFGDVMREMFSNASDLEGTFAIVDSIFDTLSKTNRPDWTHNFWSEAFFSINRVGERKGGVPIQPVLKHIVDKCPSLLNDSLRSILLGRVAALPPSWGTGTMLRRACSVLGKPDHIIFAKGLESIKTQRDVKYVCQFYDLLVSLGWDPQTPNPPVSDNPMMVVLQNGWVGKHFDQIMTMNRGFSFAVTEDMLNAAVSSKVPDYFIHQLVALGADPNFIHGKRTPLGVAMRELSYTRAATLLSCGADPNRQELDGKTPLSILFSKKNANVSFETPRIVELLLSSGADPSITCNDGRHALHFACLNAPVSVLSYFLSKGYGHLFDERCLTICKSRGEAEMAVIESAVFTGETSTQAPQAPRKRI